MHNKDSSFIESYKFSLLNEAYLDIFRVLVDLSSTTEEISEVFLDKAKQLTGSKFGYVNTIDPETGIATSRTISKMMRKDCKTSGHDNRITFPPGKDGRYPSLWGFALNEKKSFFTNDPLNHSSSKGLPKGHITVDNYLSVPVISDGILIGQIALANSKTGYSQEDLKVIEKLTDLYIIAVRIKQTEHDMKAQREKYKVLVENMYEGLWQIDKNAVTVYVNSKMVEMLGYTAEEMTGKSLFEFMDANERKSAEENLKRRKSGIKEEHDFEFIRKDGSRIFTRLETAPLFDRNGNYNGALANITDITERKHMEEMLRSNEKMLKKIFDILPVGLWVADKNGKLIMSNKKGSEIWGAEPLVGQKGYGVFKARRLPSGQEIKPDDWALSHTINEGITVTDEMLEIDAFDGKKKIILNYTAPVMDDSGKVEAGIVVNLDISERMWAEKKLAENEQRYRKLFETSPVGIAIISSLGVITSCNDAIAEYAGIPKEKIIGKDFTKLGVLKTKDILRYEKIFSEVLEGKITEPFIINFYNDAGVEFIAEAYTSHIEENENVKTIQMILRDITKELKAERDLKKSYRQIKKTLEGTISTLSSILEIKDPYTGNHQRNVANLCRAMAAELLLDEDETEKIYTAALIHDIGKIAIPASILSKPSELTGIEISMIHTHSQVGYEILCKIDFGYPLHEIVLQHHERIDGSGYPNGLKDMDILFDAKVLAVADTVEAMANHRPYRPAHGIEKALKEIQSKRGIYFNKSAVDACIAVFEKKKFKF